MYCFPQCECSFDYNDLQFHIMGHLMKCDALFLHQHLIKYIEKYSETVKYVRKTFLSGKGQTLQDYTAYLQQPGNCGDELSLYLCARMCTKHIAVITKTSVWYTGKFHDGKDFIGLNDVDLILVYLGKGVFCDPKEKPTHVFHPLPVPETTPARSANNEDNVPPPVYDPESPHRIPHTRSMGAPQV